MTAPSSVSYSAGMFANEPMGDYSSIAACIELEASCYHEASHAVVDYMIGRPLQSVGVCVTYSHDEDGATMVAYGGKVLVRHRGGRTKIHVDYDYRRSHFYLGCALAAGPAGERRYRHEAQIPMRILGASEEDHAGISSIGKALAKRGRCRWAYQRLVWHHAQKIVSDDTVWNAISRVGDELYFESSEQFEDEHLGQRWAYIDPRAIYAYCRQAGLKRGMLLTAAA